MTTSLDLPEHAARLLGTPITHLIDGAGVPCASGETFPRSIPAASRPSRRSPQETPRTSISP